MPSGTRQKGYTRGMRATSFPSSADQMTVQNLSLLNESYATAITMSQANRTQNLSEVGVVQSSFAQQHHPIDDALADIDAKLKSFPGPAQLPPQSVTSPSRFKLGMYKLNQVLDPPRSKGVKDLGIRRVMSTEKKPRRLIDQFIQDYATVRPGQHERVLQSEQSSKLGRAPPGHATATVAEKVVYMPFLEAGPPTGGEPSPALPRTGSAEKGLARYAVKA